METVRIMSFTTRNINMECVLTSHNGDEIINIHPVDPSSGIIACKKYISNV